MNSNPSARRSGDLPSILSADFAKLGAEDEMQGCLTTGADFYL